MRCEVNRTQPAYGLTGDGLVDGVSALGELERWVGDLGTLVPPTGLEMLL